MRTAILALALALPTAAVAGGWNIDPAFLGSDVPSGGPGRVAVSFNGDAATQERAVAVLRDDAGRLLVVGQTRSASPFYRASIALVRLLPSGLNDPSYGTNGKVVVENSFVDEIIDAAFDSQGRIVVLGNCGTCGPSGEGRAVLLRLTSGGALDAAFAGGRVAFGLRSNFETGLDHVANTMLVLADDSIVVGGAEVGGGVASPQGRSVSAAGVPGPGPSQFSLAGEGDPTVIDIVRDGTRTVWLIAAPQTIGSNAPIATLMRFNADYTRDDGFGANGTYFLRADFGNTADTGCGLAQPYTPVALVNFRSTLKVFLHRTSPPFGVAYASVAKASQTTNAFRCLDTPAVTDFAPRAASVVTGDLTGSIALAGICDFNPCGWRTRRPPGASNDTLLVADAGFSPVPLKVPFAATTDIVPSGAAWAVTANLGSLVIAGERRFNLAGARDFAVVRFVDGDLFRSGFE